MKDVMLGEDRPHNSSFKRAFNIGRITVRKIRGTFSSV